MGVGGYLYMLIQRLRFKCSKDWTQQFKQQLRQSVGPATPVWVGMCTGRPPLKGAAPRRPRQWLLLWNASQVLPDVRVFMWNLPRIKHLQSIQKTLHTPTLTCPRKNLNIPHSQTCQGPGAASLGQCLVISSLWCKPSHPPSSNQTVVTHCRHQRMAVGCKGLFRRIGRLT